MVEHASRVFHGSYAAPDGSVREGNIHVVDGIIREIGCDCVPDIAYGDGLLMLPGFIDIHVHARQYFLPENPADKDRETYAHHALKEDYTSASRAAINGGVVAFADMPNNPNPPVDRESYDAKASLAGKECSVDCLVYAWLQKGSVAFGNVPYKMYTHDLHKKEIRDIFRALSYPAKLNGRAHYTPLVVAHCENRKVIEKDKSRPSSAETCDIETVLDYSKQFKLPVHIAHVSTAKGLEMIVAAKNSGIRVTCETTPTYLFFSSETRDLFRASDYLFMKPPLRSEADRRRLLMGLRKGEIDALATDHAPHTAADKDAGAFGIPLLDNYTNFVGWLMQEGIPMQSILNCCCVFPGLFMERYTGERFGKIEPGYVGSFTVVGRKRPEDILAEPLFTKCGWTPFAGTTFGHDYLIYAHETIVRGKPLKAALVTDYQNYQNLR